MAVTVNKVPIRETPEYKAMEAYHACECAEGFGTGEHAGTVERLAAWQYIYDTGLWRHLQGFYGREVHALLADGLIEPAKLEQ